MPYSVAADVSNVLNLTFSGSTVPTTTQVTDLITRGDSYIDEVSGHNWTINGTMDELSDATGTGPRAGGILLRNRPVLTVFKVEYWDGGTQTWVQGTPGFPEQAPANQTYYTYLPEGKIVWHKLRLDQRQRYRVTYTWGYSPTPDFIRDLSSSIAARDTVTFWGSQLGVQEDIGLFKKRLDERINRLIAKATRTGTWTG